MFYGKIRIARPAAKLLYLLNCEHGLVTGKDLAARLGISERTVRNDVNEINEKMSEYKVKILATREKGTDLKVGSRKFFMNCFRSRTSSLRGRTGYVS